MTEANTWTKEAIFALLGVCATVFCFVISLTWGHLRRNPAVTVDWLGREFHEMLATHMLTIVVGSDHEMAITDGNNAFTTWEHPDVIRIKQQEAYCTLLEIRRGGF